MNAEQLAAALDGREYRNEITKEEEWAAKENGLVIVFGASDDLMEFRGAIYGEIDCYEGGAAHFTSAGLLVNECENDHCPHFTRLEKAATIVRAKWSAEPEYSWTYETAIPHASFDIMEDGEKYCRGIVFALADVP